MKYRIITNGTKFRIQRRYWFWWETLTETHFMVDGSFKGIPEEYDTESEVIEKLKKLTSPPVVSRWRVYDPSPPSGY